MIWTGWAHPSIPGALGTEPYSKPRRSTTAVLWRRYCLGYLAPQDGGKLLLNVVPCLRHASRIMSQEFSKVWWEEWEEQSLRSWGRTDIHKSFQPVGEAVDILQHSANWKGYRRNPLTLVAYCIIPSNHRRRRQKAEAEITKNLMINQTSLTNGPEKWLYQVHQSRYMEQPLQADPARHQSSFCPHREPLGPNSTVLDCVRSGMDEVILNVSERSFESQKDFAIVQVQI